jgi:hypothetical protein
MLEGTGALTLLAIVMQVQAAPSSATLFILYQHATRFDLNGPLDIRRN